MIDNKLYRLQPATALLKYKHFPDEQNTTPNPRGIAEDVIMLGKQKPIGNRLVSCYCRTNLDGSDFNGDYLPINSMLNISNTDIDEYRKESSLIEKQRILENLPIFCPCCALRADNYAKTYFPISYTCLIDFDILQDDNPKIDLMELKREISDIPQVYYCGLATNGIDLFCVVPIAYPHRYLDHATALRRLFNGSGIIIRTYYQIAHTRTISSDIGGYFNPNAIEFTKL